ncbi:MAG: hypothetical protein ABSA48_15005 [Terracidiphilus sp.]|jgi:hypothetical protein
MVELAMDDGNETNISNSEFPRRKPGQSRSDYLMEVSNFTAPRMKDGPTYEAVMNELYDPETGLPR